MIEGYKHDVWPIVPLVTWEALYDAMGELKVDCLWVLPSDPLSKHITYDWLQDIPGNFDYFSPPTNLYDGKPYTIKLRRKHYDSTARYIVFPAHMECAIPRRGDRGQWNLPDGNTLVTTLDYLENELGMPYLWTNGHIGEQYLRFLHQSIRTKIIPFYNKRQLDFFKGVLHGAMDRPVWRKLGQNGKPGLTPEERGKKLIVGVDKNGQYVGAANSVYLGNGNYTEVPAGAYNPHQPGFWKYRILDVSDTPFNGYNLPCPLDVNRQWASTILINTAIKVGVDVYIEHGIHWTQSGRYLQCWASELWRKRVNLRNAEEYPNEIARDNAERTMKSIPNSMVGRFMNTYSNEYFHKDWQLGIIHQAIASQAYSLRSILQKYDLKPVLVVHDTMYFLVDDLEIIDKITYRSEQLGGFKRIGVAPLNSTIIDAFHEVSSIHKLENLIREEMKEHALSIRSSV